MGRLIPLRVAAVVLAALMVGLAAPLPLQAQEQAEEENALGREVYDQWCAGCHGVDGAGEGPGAARMLPRPRDFTRAQYQIRTTGSGELPTDEDILHIIDVGMPGTAMPGWEDILTRAERRALVDYLKTFSRFFSPDAQPDALDFGRAPSANDERVARGADLYQEMECWQCHGQAGRGDGSSAPTLEDDDGFPVHAADLTENWLFNGGGSVEEIYRRLRTGMDGTPMPTFMDMVDADLITNEDLWSVAHYVRSLSPDEPPEVREVIVSERLDEGELPAAPDDERWAEVESFYVPVVGQILLPPRWFAPRVDGLWIQALHDDETLAMRVSWTDPSRSPAPAWADFARAVDDAMEPEEDAGWAPGAPDRLMVQFPQTPTEGMERPFFLHGDDRSPVHLWTWESDSPDQVREQEARGLGTAEDQGPGDHQVAVSAAHAEGRWQVVLQRPLESPDSARDVQLVTGRTIPVAFQVQDGDHAEAGGRAAISTWYLLYLGEPTPLTAYVSPVVALVLTVLLGLLAIRQARKKERSAGETSVDPGGPRTPGTGEAPAYGD